MPDAPLGIFEKSATKLLLLFMQNGQWSVERPADR
jgi:hypothetical protein